MPSRVQLRRTAGWRKPSGVISCSRPGRWGNPFHVTKTRDAATCVALFRNMIRGVWDPAVVAHLSEACRAETYLVFTQWLRRFHGDPRAAIRSELRGRDLGCWCKPGEPCHVDVLLEVANG